ncbi:hypothetical protein [uncultured Sulfitobacter sp.]|uniref:hypothetical protein n=1 Tax=Sulfitobacter sp. SH22 TaxID=3421172 RepID=UPI0025F4FB5D|nr:hypothetical protein [uncultured Sulfitobacter sp.]
MVRSCVKCGCVALLLAGPLGFSNASATELAGKSTTHPLASSQRRGDLDLQYWQASTFKEDLSSLIAMLSAGSGSEYTETLMDTAELYLTHMLLDEASSVLDRVVPDSPVGAKRYRALSDAAALLKGDPVETFATSPLSDPARTDMAFWSSLQAISSSDGQLLQANIKSSFTGLGQQSKAVLRELLPLFVEAMVELDLAQHADIALRLIKELPELVGTPTEQFLIGRANERRDNDAAALVAYLEAAEGQDVYAARARLAIADMALKEGGRGALLAAQSILENGSESWRGDNYELELHRRMARVYHLLHNEVEEALTLGKMLARFPAGPKVEETRKDAQDRLAAIYQKGAEGKYPLSDWMKLHLRLLPVFRTLPGFADQIEILADYVLKLGSTDLAAMEYRSAIRITQEQEEAQQVDFGAELFRLNMKLAKAQLKGGLLDQARVTLDLMDLNAGKNSIQDYRILKARVLSGLGDRGKFLEVFLEDPSVDHLRNMGMALSEEEQWEQSADVYLQMWSSHPKEFELQDAARLLIAVNRSGDLDALDRIVRAFPDLTESKHLISMVNNIDSSPSPLLPLRVKGAVERLERLDAAIDSIKKSGISP